MRNSLSTEFTQRPVAILHVNHEKLCFAMFNPKTTFEMYV